MKRLYHPAAFFVFDQAKKTNSIGSMNGLYRTGDS